MSPPEAKPLPLEEAIDELVGLLKRASTVEICGYVSALWMKQGPEVVKDSGLSSPQRQTSYLIGLLMTTEEPEAEEPLPEGSWERIIALLNVITDSYVHKAMAGITLGEVDAKKSHAATLAFLQRFMSGRLAVAEQLERLIHGLCAPFDEKIRAAVGISSTEALEIVEWMKTTLIDQWEIGFKKIADAKAMQSQTVDMLFSGPESHDVKLKQWQASDEFKSAQAIAEAVFEFTRYPNCIEIANLVERFGQERADAFLRLFALHRGSTVGFRYFASPNPPNPAELVPLIILEDKFVCAPMHAMLYNALYDSFDEILRANKEVKDRYLKTRADYLEARANALIAGLFPDPSLVLSKYYETARAEQEHDGLLLVERSLVVIEEKSSEMKTPSRDVERCFRNLTDHFKSNRGIQHAYNQANRVVDLVESATAPIRFYDATGGVIAEVDPRGIDESFAICVTLESFGVLAIDLTLLLQVPEGEQYPWVVNLYDLETLVDAFHRKGLTGEDFLRYLRHRRSFQGCLTSDDELNIAGQFLVEGKLPSPAADTIQFVTGYADVFDDLYFQQHGVESNLMSEAIPGGVNMDLKASLKAGEPVFIQSKSSQSRNAQKIGRNDPCPCGSRKKYKKCCGQ